MVKPRTPEEEAAFLVALRETAERSMAEDEARQAQETDSETQA